MPDRFLLALFVAATCWSLSTDGNAQGLGAPGRSRPIAPMNSQPYPTAPTTIAPGIPVAYPPTYGESAGVAADPNRKLQAGDQLLVKIEQDREGATAVAISSTGDVIVEPIPQPIRVSGMSLAAATNEIKRLLEKDYYYTATVRLTVERASSPVAGSITLAGNVNRVGPQPLFADKPLKLSKAIIQAGGFSRYANERNVRVTRIYRDGSSETIICDMKEVIQKGRVEKDLLLLDGDQIFVPQNTFQN